MMANFTNHDNNKKLAPEVIAEIQRRVDVLKEPKTAVAAALGLSYSAVRKYSTPNPDFFVSTDKRAEVIALVGRGVSRKAAAERVGISRDLVGKLVGTKKRRQLTDEEQKKLIDDAAKGIPIRTLARSLGIDVERARNIARLGEFTRRVLHGEAILPVAKELKIGIHKAYAFGNPLMAAPSNEKVTEIKSRLERGQSPIEISKELRVLLRHILTLENEPKELVSDGSYVSDATKDRAILLLRAGLSAGEVGARLNLRRQFVGLLSENQSNKKISSAAKQKLIEAIKEGKTVSAAARQVGIDKNWAFQIAEAEIPKPTDDQKECMRKLRRQGKSYVQIASELGTIVKAVTDVLGPVTKSLNAEVELAIATKASQMATLKAIAEEYGISPTRAKEIYKRFLAEGKVEPRIATNMEDDKTLERLKRNYPRYEPWRQFALRYYTVVKGNYGVVVTAVHRFFEYLSENNLYVNPADFLLRANKDNIPSFFEFQKSKTDHAAAINNAIVDFLDWILIQDEFVIEDDDDVPITIPSFRNPLNPEVRSDHNVKRNAESDKTVMPYWLVSDLRRRIVQGPNFRDWKFAQTLAGKLTLSGDKESREWFEVSEDRIDRSDPDCVYRLRERIDEPPVLEMWSPVRISALLLKLQTTGRLGQIRMLDSGEADTFIFENGTFKLNQNEIGTGTGGKERRQGAIRKSEDGSAILFFNTNKTQDIGKVGDEKGQECPWPHLPDYADDPYWVIEKLARWQSKYNPTRLVKWSEVPSNRRLKGKSEKVCSTYPDVAFLFRTPEQPGYEMFPVSYGACWKAWQRLIEAYEHLLIEENRTHPDGSKIELINKETGNAKVSPHGLRVSLITHLILDGGMPVEMMVRIVGHATFLMTIYYVKPGLARIQEALKSAAGILEANKDHTLIRDLRTLQLEELRNRVVTNANDLSEVMQFDTTQRNAIGWLEMYDGICLAGGNTSPVAGNYHIPGCHNGGPPVSESGRGHNGSTPGGIRNCCRCRWKLTGKKHLSALQAAYNNKNFHRQKASEVALKTERNRFALLDEKARSENEGRTFEKAFELAQAERHHLQAMQKMEQLALDMVAIHVTINKVFKLPDEPGKLALVSGADERTLEAVIVEIDSDTLMLCEVVEDLEIWPELDGGTAVFELTRLLDTAFEREGHPLKLAHLSDEEQLACCNAIMRDLEVKANPEDPRIGRRLIARAIDREESLKEALGVTSLKQVVPNARSPLQSRPLRLISSGAQI